MTKSKVLVIGLDGATFDWLGPWAAKGELPHLAQLLSEGVHARLESTLPYLSPPAWASFLTGMNPGKHGVFGFVEANSRMQHAYDQGLPIIGSTSIRAPTLWQQINAQGRRVGLLNVPITWPPQTVDGFMVSDSIFTPDEGKAYTYPPDLKTELLNAIPEYRVRPYTFHDHSPRHIKEVTYYTGKQAEAALWLMERFPWHFFMVVFGGVDILQHAFWKYLDPNNPAYQAPEAEDRRRLLRTFYQTVDESIGRLVERARPETPVLLMSDHGFASGYRIFYANRWLYELGLLGLHQGKAGWKARLMNMGLTPERVLRLIKRVDVLELHKRLSSRAGLVARDRVRRAIRSAGPTVNWACTKAYAGGADEPFIYINVKGRQPVGTVAPGGEYEALRNRLIAELRGLRDPQSGELVIGDVYRREELYDGPYLEQAPDLIYDFRLPGYFISEVVATTDLFDDEPHGTSFHHRQGIFLARGPDIRQGIAVDKANILDLAPTLLYLLGLNVPRDMDGSVLTEIFDEAFLASHPVRYVTLISNDNIPQEEGEAYAPDEMEQIHTRLKDLGYL